MSRSGKILAVLLLALCSGCVQRTLSVTSDPPGALVFMNDQEIGRTPLKRDFTWYGTYDVQVRKEGYETISKPAPIIAPPWLWPPFDLFAELWPFRIKDERQLAYTMKPISSEASDAGVMMAHAEEMRAQLESSKYTPTTRPATKPAEK